MNRRSFILAAGSAGAALGQGSSNGYDLSKLTETNGLRYLGCTSSAVRESGRNAVHLSAGCVAYIEGAGLANGVIELDLRGQDVQQQSFLGVVFHGVDGAAYDSIYFFLSTSGPKIPREEFGRSSTYPIRSSRGTNFASNTRASTRRAWFPCRIRPPSRPAF